MTPLRARLFSPPNMVPDAGIDLRRRRGVEFRPKDITIPLRPYPGFWFWPISGATVDEIIESAAQVFGVSVNDIKGHARNKPLVTYRMATVAICRRLSLLSLPRIGQRFGSRNHTAVLHAVRKMQPHIDAVATELPADAPALEWARAMRRRIGS